MPLVVSAHGRSRFTGLLGRMHRDRKTVFVDRLGWDIPVVKGEYEIDQFDGDGAIYLVVEDADGAHAGSLRLLPTTKPHLLSDVFPHLCARDVPRAPDIWEVTRLCTAPHHPDAKSVRRELMLGLLEWGVANDVRRYTMMTHVPYLSAVLAAGWDCAPLGLPQDDHGVTVGALAVNVNAETLAMMRMKRGVCGPVLRWEALDAA